MRTLRRLLFGGLLCAALASLATPRASAQPADDGPWRVVVEGFGGPQGATYRNMLVAALRDARYEVLSSADVRSATQAGAHGDVEVAAQLQARAYIEGRVARTPRSWSLVVRVRNGADGRVAGTVSWSGATIAALSVVRRNGVERLRSAISACHVPSAASGQHVQDDRTARNPYRDRGDDSHDDRDDANDDDRADGGHGGGGSDDDADDEAAGGRGRTSGRTRNGGSTASTVGGSGSAGNLDFGRVGPRGDDDEHPGRESGDDEDGDAGDAPADDGPTEPDGSQRFERMFVTASAGWLHRSLSGTIVPVNAMMEAIGDPEPRDYRSAGLGHAEAGLSAEVYPFAFGRQQSLPYVGFLVSYRHSLAVSSRGCSVPASTAMPCPMNDVVDVPSSQQELYLGARGRYRFGKRRRDLTAFADMGFGLFDFSLDPAAVAMLDPKTVIPPIGYRYFLVGAGASYGLVPTYLRVDVHASYRFGLGVSDSARDVWGTGSATNSGFALGFELRSGAPYITRGLYFSVAVDYFVHQSAYSGDPRCIRPADEGGCRMDHPEDPWPLLRIPKPIDDAYVRLAIGIGYALE